MRILPLSVAAGAFVLSGCSEPVPTTTRTTTAPDLRMEEVHVVPGSCERLHMSGKDLTSLCVDKLGFTTTQNDRVQAAFIMESGSTVMFAGPDLPNPSANMDAIAVDRVYLNSAYDSSVSGPVPASGRCTYTNPYAGPLIVECVATGSGNVPYSARFRSDSYTP